MHSIYQFGLRCLEYNKLRLESPEIEHAWLEDGEIKEFFLHSYRAQRFIDIAIIRRQTFVSLLNSSH